MSSQPTSPGTPPSTCSPGSEAGPTPSTSPGGPPTDLFGQPHALALRSASRGAREYARHAQAQLLSGILAGLAWLLRCLSPRVGRGRPPPLARSAPPHRRVPALQSSLASRLQASAGWTGSPECEVHWNSAAMLLGPSLPRLQASERRTSATAYSGWPTPKASTGGGDPNNTTGVNLEATAQLASWPTPRSNRGSADSHGDDPLTHLAPWTTPLDRDWERPPRGWRRRRRTRTGRRGSGSTRCLARRMERLRPRQLHHRRSPAY